MQGHVWNKIKTILCGVDPFLIHIALGLKLLLGTVVSHIVVSSLKKVRDRCVLKPAPKISKILNQTKIGPLMFA